MHEPTRKGAVIRGHAIDGDDARHLADGERARDSMAPAWLGLPWFEVNRAIA